MRRFAKTVFAGYDSAPDRISGTAKVAYSSAQPETTVFPNGIHRRNLPDRFQVSEYLFSLRHELQRKTLSTIGYLPELASYKFIPCVWLDSHAINEFSLYANRHGSFLFVRVLPFRKRNPTSDFCFHF